APRRTAGPSGNAETHSGGIRKNCDADLSLKPGNVNKPFAPLLGFFTAMASMMEVEVS
ncbi:hypothetical protein PLESTB_001770100, partial [Pleodorina starrii]